ncbi:uncharacterized protein K460DRAFT_360669 [Cucurbitaria berberidis CBS 394.84]|uniref:Uncharacterized protein n=1 Tax=Cucurbitaria berberidis CBS 394.84 TaxID=1168544 RepID=A0A9P4GRL7_9PLEO|nr:uncharacterized protein K460DRAFT_360669 [Cucurbitaria berberidis CBS 394.84]KAF1849821.1 hypothetical protein K460DRAFT_360669 [Cucurbitaria berberidis CBS 394.84]
MLSNCHVCEHRNEAVAAWPSAPSQLNVCIVTLRFKIPITQTRTHLLIALNTLLNNIIDNEESTPHPSTFTVWSPCLSDPRTVVIVTTTSDVCSTATSPIFNAVREHLSRPPSVQHVYLDLAVLSLAAASPEQRVSCDIITLQAPSPTVASAIGKHFGWDPKRSCLSSRLQRPTVAFSRPGDLIRDFWAWAEVSPSGSRSPSTSIGSSSFSSPSLMSLHSDHYNMSCSTPENGEQLEDVDKETLITIFQWTSRADADRFKDHSQKSYGPNGEEVRRDLWDTEFAHPLAHLQRLGAKVDTYKLELRAVEPRFRNGVDASPQKDVREKRRSKRLSVIAFEFGERVSGLWK